MTYAIKAPARYVQGAGILKDLGRNAKKLGERFLVVATESGWSRFGAQVEASLTEQGKQVLFTPLSRRGHQGRGLFQNGPVQRGWL